MAAAFIDSELGKLIEATLVENKNIINRLLNDNGPLATFCPY